MRKISIYFMSLLFLGMSSCGEADLSTEPVFDPEPVMAGVSFVATDATSGERVSGVSVVLRDIRGDAFTLIPGLESALLSPTDTIYYDANEYRSVVVWYEKSGYISGGRNLSLRPGEVRVVDLRIEKQDVSNPVNTALVAVNSNPAATVDSVVRISGDSGGRVRLNYQAQSTPTIYTLEADSSAYLFYVSAPGYLSTVGMAFPEAGRQYVVNLTLDPVPVAGSVDAKYLIASIPEGMRADVYLALDMVNASLVASVTTSDTLRLSPDFYRITCSDPSGRYATTNEFVSVSAGRDGVVVCRMPEVANPPAAVIAQISVNSTSVNFGDSVTLSVTSANASEGFLSPLNVFTTGGSFTHKPFTSTQYCYVAFGSGGSDVSCVYVTVSPPAPNLVPDTVRITVVDPYVSVSRPREFLWNALVSLTGQHVGNVQIRILAKYSGDELGQTDESFALRMRDSSEQWAGYVTRPGEACPVVRDDPSLSGWYWINVGEFDWDINERYEIWAHHAILFDGGESGSCYQPTGNWGDGSHSVNFTGIEFIRWIQSP